VGTPLQIALIGAPTDVGGASPGTSMGPDALRVAGLRAALRRLGHSVIDTGNLAGPRHPLAEPVDGYRNLDEVVAWCAAVRDAFRESLVAGQFPILLGGDHSLAIGSIAGCAHHCAAQKMPLSVLWLDAHADYNTTESTPTGNLHGMPLAVLTGKGPPPLLALGAARPVLRPANVVQLGIRSVDQLERPLLMQSGITVVDMRQIDEHGMREVMDTALRKFARIGGHLHVSLDVDFIDPSVAPGVATAVQGGPTYRETQLCMEMIHDAGLMRSLDIVELNPAFDVRNSTARLMVDLAASLFGQQILSRADVSY
jgi:arginase